MISFLPVLFFVAMTVDIIVLFVVANDKYGKNRHLNFSFSFMCCGNIFSNIGYAILLMQSGDGVTAMVSYSAALTGILIFRIFALATFIYWLDYSKIVKRCLLILESVLCIVFTVLFVVDADVYYINSIFGGTFAVSVQKIEMIYYFFKLFLQIIFLAITIIIFLKSKNKRAKRLTVGMFGFDLALFFDILFDFSAQNGELLFFPIICFTIHNIIKCLLIIRIHICIY